MVAQCPASKDAHSATHRDGSYSPSSSLGGWILFQESRVPHSRCGKALYYPSEETLFLFCWNVISSRVSAALYFFSFFLSYRDFISSHALFLLCGILFPRITTWFQPHFPVLPMYGTE